MTDSWTVALNGKDIYDNGEIVLPRVKGLNFVGAQSVELNTSLGIVTVTFAGTVKHQVITVSEVISGGNVTIDFNDGLSCTLIMNVSITGTLTLVPPTILADQATCPKLTIKQTSPGSKTIAAWSGAVFIAGTAPTLSTAAGTVNVITAVMDGTDNIMRFVASPSTGAGFPS